MKTSGKRSAIAAGSILALVLAGSWSSLRDRILEWWPWDEANLSLDKESDGARELLEGKREEIEREIEAIGGRHPWAGRYYAGDGLGRNISLCLAPRSGFAYSWNGCLGLYDLNFGRVRGSRPVELRCRLPNGSTGFCLKETKLIPVAWGERRYLIGASEVVDFCNACNSGFEPRASLHGWFLLERTDPLPEASGSPTLPEEFQKCLLKKPLTTRITALGKSSIEEEPRGSRTRSTSVTVDIGSAEGAFEGMELHLVEPGPLGVGAPEAETSKVLEHSAEVLIVHSARNEDRALLLEPRVGWILSTRPSRPPGRAAR